MNDKQIHISAANSRRSTVWPEIKMTWSGFIERIRTPHRTAETYDAFMAMTKPEQDDLKDVGGFVGGTLKNNRRKAANVLSRDLITLDMDNIPAGEAHHIDAKIQMLFGCAYAIYSTRKHSSYKPRLRVIIPTDRPMGPDEYEPISRKVAEMIGMAYADPTTFQGERLMYWPSCSSDSEYFYKAQDGGFLRADAILAMYADWHDVSQWPHIPGQTPQDHAKLAQKQGDPLTKTGVVGAFCRSYTIQDAMDRFIPESYEATDQPNRYTYRGGSTAGGAIIYDDKFLYSYHATDPCSGKLVNAFDLVRIHLYGDQDDEAKPGTPTTRLPSYLAMTGLAVEDPTVRLILTSERLEKAKEDFNLPQPAPGQAGGPDDPQEAPTGVEAPQDTAWLAEIDVDRQTGKVLSSSKNMRLIIRKDPALAGKVALDEFANRGVALGALPWNQTPGKRNWSDTDDAGIRDYLETVYRISGKEKIYDALLLEAHKNRFDEIKDYLTGLSWDGQPRLDTLFIDYLGAEDNPYTRAVARKSLSAAVARAMCPGTKYDHMPILAGPQGIGKSTLLLKLGREWYSDSLTTFEGKEAAEMIQGVWINEIGELNGLNRSETNAVKQFLSKVEDLFRVPYGRRTEVFKRRCVFFGTSNDDEFLKDRTGNRRFWPIDCAVQTPKKSIWDDLEREVPQIWAEATERWRAGEPLYLTGEVEEISKRVQAAHMETSSKQGLIEEYLAKPLPANWDSLDIAARRMWFTGYNQGGAVDIFKRRRVSAIEVWCECLGKDEGAIKRQDSVEINGILRGLDGWHPLKSSARFGPYGTQRGYQRDQTELDEIAQDITKNKIS